MHVRTGSRLTPHDITPEMELELVRRYQAGDSAAGGVLVSANEGVIRRCVARYFGHGLRMEDIMQAARLGFAIGVMKFCPDRGARVTTYALYWAQKEAHDTLLAEGSTIRIPRDTQDRIYRAAKSGDPMPPKLARAARLRRTRSADVLVGDGDMTLLDLTVSPEATPDVVVEAEDAQARRRELIARAMTRLNPQEREVIQRRFCEDPEALAAIGASWDMSRERARQIEENAMTKLRMALRQIMSPDDAVLWSSKFTAGPIRPRPRPAHAPPVAAEPTTEESAPPSGVMPRRRRAKTAAVPSAPANDTVAPERAAP